MSQNKNDELELEYLDDESYLEEDDNNSEDEYIELFEEIDEDEEYEDDLSADKRNMDTYDDDEELNEEFADDEDLDNDAKKVNLKKENNNKEKLPKNVIVNRVMIGMGIAIACFTIFYAIVIADMFKAEPAPEPETNNVVEQPSTEVIEQPTEEPEDDSVFTSPYLDTNISQEVKDILCDVSLDSMDSGLNKLELRVENVISKAVNEDKTIYENVRNIYDYFIKNFEVTNKSYVDEDAVYDTCSSVDYKSYFDMELIYRANKALNKKSGSPEDLACALTIVFRSYGLEAYYIEGEAKIDGEYEDRGYTVVAIDDEYYVFDVAYEMENITDEANLELEYATFCKTFDEVEDIYNDEGVEDSIDNFEEFATLPQLTFDAEFSTDNGGSTSGRAKYIKGYSESGNSTDAGGDIIINLGEKIYLDGSVSNSGSNTWKLNVKVFDTEMNYVTESVLYNVTTDSKYNSVTYTPSIAGYVRLNYMVTDAYGRTCTVYTIVEVVGEEETSTDDEDTSKEEESTDDESTSEEEDSTPETTSPKYPPYEPDTSDKTTDPTSSKEEETSQDETTSKDEATDNSESSGEVDNPEETTSSM
ncbi:MAG: hypothetical protein IJA34_15240 [Lachnospiraceae bacterium]|nr:hypothetical protein [Lachnospiraceae bacterium]